MKKLFKCLVIFAALAMLFSGCATSKSNEFQNKIKRMSDNDLISYYHGINDRIKDIDNDIKRDESPNPTEQEKLTSNIPFIIGGEGYRLVKRREMVLDELDARNLKP